MAIKAKCAACSHSFIVSKITGGTFTRCRTPCPHCGSMADIQDGTYQLIDEAVTAFRAPGVGREEIIRFQDIAKNVQSGAISPSIATDQIEEMGSTLAALWRVANSQAGVLSLLLAIITLYLTISESLDSDAAAERQLRATERQTLAIHSAERVQQMILEELQKQPAGAPEPELPSPTTGQTKQLSPSQRPASAEHAKPAEGRKAHASAEKEQAKPRQR